MRLTGFYIEQPWKTYPGLCHQDTSMGFVDLVGIGIGHTLPDGRMPFANMSFRVGEGAKVALVGPNGAGKTLGQ